MRTVSYPCDYQCVCKRKPPPVNIFIGIKGIDTARQLIYVADDVLWRNGIVSTFIISSWRYCHVRRTYLRQEWYHPQTVPVVRPLQVRLNMLAIFQ